MSKNYCVIMAGGIGSRFWPFSRTSKPKQFLDILGTGKTLIQQTFERFNKLIPSENILFVTNTDYNDIILEQIPDINPNQVLLEPIRRNTAPCIAYANHKILKSRPDANIVVAPSDHLILKEDVFLQVVKESLEFVENKDALLTLGIKPSRPETGYGYIQINYTKKNTSANESIFKVKTFTEKPDLEMARVFLESGEFFWNAGIFFWSLPTIMKAFDKNLNDINSIFAEGAELYNTDEEQVFIDRIYPSCKNISIDYGIMEKAENVFVYCTDFGWSDLGTWGSLHEKLRKDKNKNSIVGSSNVFIYDSKDCIINTPEDTLVVLQGLEDYIIVESDKILLICKKEDEQKIKQFVNDIRINKGDEFI